MLVDLKDYGFRQDDFLTADRYGKDTKDLIPGRIIEVHRERFIIVCEHGEVSAEIKGSFYHDLEEGNLFPVVGDFVLMKFNDKGSSLIDTVLARSSRFSRVDFLGHSEGYAKNVQEQVIAANFDYVFILTSLNYDLNMNRLSRYLTASMQSGAFPVFVLTKADLLEDSGTIAAEVRKMAREVPVITISSKTGYGLDELAPFLEPAKTVVFLGSSGVGKSSLLNRLAGEELMEVKAIREDDSKGRHTTTHRQMFLLSSGALVIDTPGMRELGLWDSTEGISMAFTEVEELFPQCRFSNCSHQSEPGCAVQAALEDGSLSPEQWEQYLAQRKEIAYVTDHSAYLKEKEKVNKSIAHFVKDMRKRKEIR